MACMQSRTGIVAFIVRDSFFVCVVAIDLNR